MVISCRQKLGGGVLFRIAETVSKNLHTNYGLQNSRASAVHCPKPVATMFETTRQM